jgi:hypothetical protein
MRGTQPTRNCNQTSLVFSMNSAEESNRTCKKKETNFRHLGNPLRITRVKPGRHAKKMEKTKRIVGALRGANAIPVLRAGQLGAVVRQFWLDFGAARHIAWFKSRAQELQWHKRPQTRN